MCRRHSHSANRAALARRLAAHLQLEPTLHPHDVKRAEVLVAKCLEQLLWPNATEAVQQRTVNQRRAKRVPPSLPAAGTAVACVFVHAHTQKICGMLLTRSMSRQLRSVLLREKRQAKSCTHSSVCTHAHALRRPMRNRIAHARPGCLSSAVRSNESTLYSLRYASASKNIFAALQPVTQLHCRQGWRRRSSHGRKGRGAL